MPEQRIGYLFHDGNLLRQALTHSSYANEQSAAGVSAPDYERLEYLGDAVLEMVTSDYLFHRYPALSEGELTRGRAALVCEEALYQCAREIGLSDFIRLGRGEEATGGRGKPSIVSDVMEALIGAVYLDGGLEPAKELIHRLVLSGADETIRLADAKTHLQEVAQRQGLSVRYELTGETGPEHLKTFTSAVYLGDRFLAEGSGKNKKASQQEAAKEALKILCI